MNPTEKHDGAQHVLFDADQLSVVTSDMFDPMALQRGGLLRGSAEGRGTTHFIELDGVPCVLRHYRRGGWMAGLLGDRYFRATLPASRAWREWRLLADLFVQGLPVPCPVAARVVTAGPFYRADLVTRYLQDTRSLAQVLAAQPLSAAQWRAIGGVLRRFHDAGVYHADLNAHNILLTSSGEVFLIDFDKGEIRSADGDWRQANLARLRRSLDKLSGAAEDFHFEPEEWRLLQQGWDDGPLPQSSP